jgi:DNA replication licensing factor MCM5
VISRIEKQLKRRFAIGSQVSENSIVQDFTRQVAHIVQIILLSIH